MACCTQRWWHAPVYFTVSVVLAFIAISTALHSPSTNNATQPTRPISHQLSLNTSRALRRSGFNIIANFLLTSPEIFLSSPNSTIFAIQDSALISNTSIPPRFLKQLLQYHTSPLKLPMNDLLKKPRGSCFPTLLDRKNVAATKVDAKERSVEINHVLVSHPDVFLEEHIAVHGVLGPFSSLASQSVFEEDRDSIQAPICDANFSLVSDAGDPKNLVEWMRIIRLLSSNGFVSFAIGLNTVLDGILEEHRDLNSVTIFTPPEFVFIASPSPMLEKIVRFHILPQRVTYTELASLPDKASLRTLAPEQEIQITGVVNVTGGLVINGVEIVAPEIFSSKKFIVHEISQAFEVAELPKTSR